MNWLIGVLLTVCAAEDWLTKRISVRWPIIALAVGVAIRVSDDSLLSWGGWTGVLFGMVFFLLAIISREQIGKGDGLLLTVCGFCLGWRRLLSLVLGAMMLFLAAGIWKLFGIKRKRTVSMAFVPFLWVTFLFSLIG